MNTGNTDTHDQVTLITCKLLADIDPRGEKYPHTTMEMAKSNVRDWLDLHDDRSVDPITRIRAMRDHLKTEMHKRDRQLPLIPDTE